MKDAGEQDGHEEGCPRLQAGRIAQLQQTGCLLHQPFRNGTGATRDVPAHRHQCQQQRHDDDDLHLVGEDRRLQPAHRRVEQHRAHHDHRRQPHRHRRQQRHQHRNGRDLRGQLDEHIEHHDGQRQPVQGPAIAGNQIFRQRMPMGHQLAHAPSQNQHGHQG